MMAGIHKLTLPSQMLKRGFWLYVWRIDTPKGEQHYVGRTGDSSSPFAAAPYTRMGQHLSFNKASNSLRKLLTEHGIEPVQCNNFDLISYGPIFREIGLKEGQDRKVQFELHRPYRDKVAALERDLQRALSSAGYSVLNVVNSKAETDPLLWTKVLEAFVDHFPKLSNNHDSNT